MSYKLPPKYQRYADCLRELIEEGQNVVKLAKQSSSGYTYIRGADLTKYQSWFAKFENVLNTVFGIQSSHFKQLEHAGENLRTYGADPRYIYPVIGILDGALNDLENGFLLNQEFLVAADVFDSVLEQAKHLLDTGYKDPAAVLGRVVLEDSLKRLARTNGLDDTKKASVINTDLKTANIYNQPQWRQIQAWLDIGNDSAHGNFINFSDDDVKRMLDGIEAFLATYLSII